MHPDYGGGLARGRCGPAVAASAVPVTWSHAVLQTPLGALAVVGDDNGLRVVEFADHPDRVERALRRYRPRPALADGPAPSGVRDAFDAYFSGDLMALDGLTVAPVGTALQRALWSRLRAVPAGSTVTYAELARALQRPRAARAVGAANGANPLAIVVPCHRVVAADGALAGYGGGLARKRWLLRHEGAYA